MNKPSLNSCSLADCLESMRGLPDKSVEHTITDPPYGREAHEHQARARESSRNRHLEKRDGDNSCLSFEPLSDADLLSYASEMVRLTRKWLIVFCQVETVSSWRDALEKHGNSRYLRTCIWVKPNAMPQFSGDRPGQGYETFVCAWCSPGRSEWNAGGKIGVYSAPIPRGNKRFHETQKPFSLMLEIIEDFTNKGDLILDPFAGSGTTLLAAKRSDRNFIGFEKNPEYCEIINQRLSDPFFLPERLRTQQLILL